MPEPTGGVKNAEYFRAVWPELRCTARQGSDNTLADEGAGPIHFMV